MINREIDFQELQEAGAFARYVYNRKFSFQLDEKIEIEGSNELDTFTLLDEERQLLNFAQEMGKEHVRIYCNAVHRAGLRLKLPTHEQTTNAAILTVMPPDLVEFAKKAVTRDKFWSYSDDQNVWRHGQTTETEMTLKANTGPYWKHIWDASNAKK